MKIGMIGLGRMGGNLARNLKDHDIDVVVYNHNVKKVNAFIDDGFEGAMSLEALKAKLVAPRVYWMMIPSGQPVDDMIDALRPLLESGDILIDGGNSFYKDTLRRHKSFEGLGVSYVDIGTSGGVMGARNGACMMVGGDERAFVYLEPVIAKICVVDGYGYMGESGAGHYVKMVHNGIEYGMMQAIAEGFSLLDASDFNLDYDRVSKVWGNGSIIASYLMDVTRDVFKAFPNLENLEGKIDASGEGLWTVEEALSRNVAVPVIAHSLFVRAMSKDDNQVSNKIVAGMRNVFGGHKVHSK